MSSTCPGQAALIPEGMPRYMRVACMSFWMNAEPNATIFYLHKKKVELTGDGIEALKASLTTIMKAEYPNFISLEYIGYEMVGLTDAQIADAGSRYVVGLEP